MYLLDMPQCGSLVTELVISVRVGVLGSDLIHVVLLPKVVHADCRLGG